MVDKCLIHIDCSALYLWLCLKSDYDAVKKEESASYLERAKLQCLKQNKSAFTGLNLALCQNILFLFFSVSSMCLCVSQLELSVLNPAFQLWNWDLKLDKVVQ